MSVFVACLAFVLWLVIAFFVLRFFFRNYFHEPRRAEIAALAAAVAFAIGTAWPFSVRVAVPPPDTSHAVPAPAATPERAASTPLAIAPQPPRDVSALCRSAKDPQAQAKTGANTNGSVDPVASAEHPDAHVADGGQMRGSEHYRIQGWAIAPDATRLALGVCLVIDGHIDRRSRVLYGFARPDVSAAFQRPEVTGSGFEILVPSDALPHGAHRLEVATIMDRGEARALSQARNVTVY